ncbi:hypothetical protein CDA63_08325 [Hymenobacter amundsenii]|uniref:Outer membrane protein beta-barrel domain-containing protein n=1 Tax=Hymenobacter amundsenii TaxID=2006685 RepID=A0A246FLE2_9BACT|nr:hypothetical protein CDA63_08325 [Hymenobacter amundsenii]
MQPATPLLRAKGEAEVTASAYLSGRLEGSAAYSPLNHLVVRAAGGLTTTQKDSAVFSNRQFELSLGTYRQLGPEWLVGGSGGYGRGEGHRNFRLGRAELLSDTTTYRRYAARYHTLFTDIFLAHEGNWSTWGVAYRLSQVRFGFLTNNGQPVPLRRMTRNEPMVFVRLSNRQGIMRWGQLQLASSFSWSSDYIGSSLNSPERADLKEGRIFTSVGLVIYPHRFGRAADK